MFYVRRCKSQFVRKSSNRMQLACQLQTPFHFIHAVALECWCSYNVTMWYCRCGFAVFSMREQRFCYRTTELHSLMMTPVCAFNADYIIAITKLSTCRLYKCIKLTPLSTRLPSTSASSVGRIGNRKEFQVYTYLWYICWLSPLCDFVSCTRHTWRHVAHAIRRRAYSIGNTLRYLKCLHLTIFFHQSFASAFSCFFHAHNTTTKNHHINTRTHIFTWWSRAMRVHLCLCMSNMIIIISFPPLGRRSAIMCIYFEQMRFFRVYIFSSFPFIGSFTVNLLKRTHTQFLIHSNPERCRCRRTLICTYV